MSQAFIRPINAQRAIYAVAFGVNEICNERYPSIAANDYLSLCKEQGTTTEKPFRATFM